MSHRPFEHSRVGGASGVSQCCAADCTLVATINDRCTFHSSLFLSDLSEAEVSERIARFSKAINFVFKIKKLGCYELELMLSMGKFSQFQGELGCMNIRDSETVIHYQSRVLDSLRRVVIQRARRGEKPTFHLPSSRVSA